MKLVSHVPAIEALVDTETLERLENEFQRQCKAQSLEPASSDGRKLALRMLVDTAPSWMGKMV